MPKSERLSLRTTTPPQRSFAVAVAGLHLKRSTVSVTGLRDLRATRSAAMVRGMSRSSVTPAPTDCRDRCTQRPEGGPRMTWGRSLAMTQIVLLAT